MKIHSFSFFDEEENWGIEPIYFNDLTLLVGASGVGKTRILTAVNNIKRIAKGGSLNGVRWEIKFSIEKDIFSWIGSFELKERGFISSFASVEGGDDKEDNKAAVLYEKVTINEKIVVDRKGTELTFRGDKSPIPIKAEQSVFTLIPDPMIKKAERDFRKIIYSDYTDSAVGSKRFPIIDSQLLIKYKTVDDLRNSDESSIIKIFWVYKKNKKLFNQIKDDFIDVFPQVENLKIEALDELRDDNSVPFFLKAAPFIQIKEIGIDKWIPAMSMSAGMYRTLVHLIELYLSADGTVILIDEFENSLGINCIDELTIAMKGAVDRIQFIITSHHPYIINSINYDNWKIVTRKGNMVVAKDTKEMNFQKSKHDAFIQLINSPLYKKGAQV